MNYVVYCKHILEIHLSSFSRQFFRLSAKTLQLCFSLLHDCLVPGGQSIKMAPHSGDPHSQWRFDGNKVVNQSGDVLDISRGNSSDGAEICAYKHHGKENQRWRKENA